MPNRPILTLANPRQLFVYQLRWVFTDVDHPVEAALDPSELYHDLDTAQGIAYEQWACCCCVFSASGIGETPSPAPRIEWEEDPEKGQWQGHIEGYPNLEFHIYRSQVR